MSNITAEQPTRVSKILVTNKYKVSGKLWSKFTPQAKRMFNDVMRQSLKNQDVTTHPKTAKMTPSQWNTICHNFACYAAWAIDGLPLVKGALVEDINIKTGKTIKVHKAK